MRSRLLLTLVLFSLLVTFRSASSQANTPAPPAEGFIRPNFIVRSLEARPVRRSDKGEGLPFSVGSSVWLDDQQRQTYVLSNDSIVLPFPPDYERDQSYWSFLYNERTPTVFARCSAKGLYIIDLASRQFKRVDIRNCDRTSTYLGWDFSLSWSPNGRFLAYYPEIGDKRELRFYDTAAQSILTVDQISHLTLSWLVDWSPHWDYQFYEEDPAKFSCPPNQLDAKQYFGRVFVARNRLKATTEALLCTIGWERMDVVGWTAFGQVLVAGYYPTDGGPRNAELYIASPTSHSSQSLGGTMKGEYMLFDHDTKLARIRIVDGDDQVPLSCALNIIDLKTLTLRDVEATKCSQSWDVKTLDAKHKLVYLRCPLPDHAEIWDECQTPTLQIIDLNRLTSEGVPIPNLKMVGLVSPNERYILLTADPTPDVRNLWNYMWSNPSLLIFDTTTKKVVSQYVPVADDWYEADWSRASDILLVSGFPKNIALYLTFFGKDIKTVTLSGTLGEDQHVGSEEQHLDISRYISQSPSGKFILYFTQEGIKVLRLADLATAQITTTLQTANFTVDAYWTDQDLLVVETIPIQRQGTDFSAGRWLVNPVLH